MVETRNIPEPRSAENLAWPEVTSRRRNSKFPPPGFRPAYISRACVSWVLNDRDPLWPKLQCDEFSESSTLLSFDKNDVSETAREEHHTAHQIVASQNALLENVLSILKWLERVVTANKERVIYYNNPFPNILTVFKRSILYTHCSPLVKKTQLNNPFSI